MKWFAATAAIAVAAAVPSAGHACDEHQEEQEMKAAKPTIQKLTVQELAQLREQKKAVVFDANDDQTRGKMGVIPGARLLTSAVTYVPAKELPASKTDKIVFYCASERCGASKAAAMRAAEAGYKDVAVMPQGIAGWKAAGMPTSKPGQS